MKRNYLDLTQTAGASLRYGVSSTATAAIRSGFLADQIKGTIIPSDNIYLAVDNNKVARVKDRVIKQAQSKDEARNQEEVITEVFADGRKDDTRVLIADESTGRYYHI